MHYSGWLLNISTYYLKPCTGMLIFYLSKTLTFFIDRLKLTGIKVFMKTLGSGFHQSIEGVHFLSMVRLNVQP